MFVAPIHSTDGISEKRFTRIQKDKENKLRGHLGFAVKICCFKAEKLEMIQGVYCRLEQDCESFCLTCSFK